MVRLVALLVALALLLAPALARADDADAGTPSAAEHASDAADTTPLKSIAEHAETKGRSTQASDTDTHGTFQFGSYGRVGIASDLEGRVATPINLVDHGPRFDEDSYAELEMRREDTFKGNIDSRIVATLALTAPFFHFSGKPEQMFLVRNLYAQAKIDDVVMWIGSRMYRGDDIYLLDWWPLDNQNTIGGGASYDFRKADLRIAAHVGMQRLDDPTHYQYQVTEAPSPFGLGATGVESLNRPRITETLKLTQLFRNGRVFKNPKAGMKAILYGETQEISAGVLQDPTSSQQVALPQDVGFVAGAQVGFWTGERDTHVNVYFRYGHGLGAYDPLQVPTTFANNHTTGDSQDVVVALSGNFEAGAFGILGGAYYRYFSDGSEAGTSLHRFSEGTIDVRPQVFLGEYFGVALDASYQARRYAFPDLNAQNNSALFASMWRFALMPYFSPTGRGSYKRPQFRAIYALSVPDAGYKSLYPIEDFRAQRDVQHYLGVQVEWWFNSSSYP